MKKVTLMMTKGDVEYLLNTIVEYRLELIEDESEFSERYRDSLSSTGFLLSLVSAQCSENDSDYEVLVTFDIESYLNLFDVLSHRKEVLNRNIIEAIKASELSEVEEYEKEKQICQELYSQINERRFEVLHL